MRHPLWSKLTAVALVAVLLCLVLARISALVNERSGRHSEAVRSIQQSYANAQTLLGPVLTRHCVETWIEDVGEGPARKRQNLRNDFNVHAVPAKLAVDTDLKAEARHRGLFKVNSYTGQFKLRAEWIKLDNLQAQPAHIDATLRCDAPTLWVAVADVRGVRQVNLHVNGQEMPLLPGTADSDQPQGLQAHLPEAWFGPTATYSADQPFAAELALTLVGTDRLALAPLAGATVWHLASDWPHPSFGGRFLPTAHDVRQDGFTAQWEVSALARGTPGEALNRQRGCEGPGSVTDGEMDTAAPDPSGSCADTLAVRFIDPVNPYTMADRATKYGLLFIALTFMGVALTEVLARRRVRRVHPVQYGLVGLALSLFFLLLLSLSEHLPFAWAYGGASLACVSLLGVYAAHMLGGWRDGLWLGAASALLYGLVYVLLLREQTALVIGSVGLFAAVALVMWLTRQLDWYQLLGPMAAMPAPETTTSEAGSTSSTRADPEPHRPPRPRQ